MDIRKFSSADFIALMEAQKYTKYVEATNSITMVLGMKGFSYKETLLILRTAVYAMELVDEDVKLNGAKPDCKPEDVPDAMAMQLVARVAELAKELGI